MRRTLLLAIIVIFAGSGRQSMADGEVTYGPPMSTSRHGHTATRLLDGKVLICGGVTEIATSALASASADLYDPDNDTITSVGSMQVGRWIHTATLLSDGRVLITGGLTPGYYPNHPVASAEIYDPVSRQFILLSSGMSVPRSHHTATLLLDGRVLIAGGQAGVSFTSDTRNVDVFDLTTNGFSLVGQLDIARARHDAVLMPPGDNVLLVGGLGVTATPVAAAELFSISGGSTTVGSLNVPRFYTRSHLLPNGTVLVAGGTAAGNVYSDAIEFYDPDTGLFGSCATAHLLQGRSNGSSVELADGRIAFFGGNINSAAFTATVEVFDPVDYSLSWAPSMLLDRMHPTLTVLGDGRVLVTGSAIAASTATTNTTELHSGFIVNQDPVADAGPNAVVECTSSGGTTVSLDGTGSADADGDPLTYEWSVPEDAGILLDDPTSATPTGTFPAGPTLVTLTVTDGNGGLSVDDVLVTVIDTIPPIVVCTTDLIALWPVNHKMIPVKVFLEVSDLCTGTDEILVACTVSSSEPDDATGDGASVGDVDEEDGYSNPIPVSLVYDSSAGGYTGTILLRAERDGSQSGRTYSIVCDVMDASDNVNTASCVVVVPHDKRKK